MQCKNGLKPTRLVFYGSDPGFCRLYYKVGGTLVTFQKDRSSFELFSCTRAGEPLCPSNLKSDPLVVQVPDANNSLFNEFTAYLKTLPNVEIELLPVRRG